MTSSDFHHPLLGSVLRLDPTPSILVKPQLSPNLFSTAGEWGGLQHASLLLSNRFPKQSRMYLHHMPKSLSRSLVHEASIMFAGELTTASTRGFRESKRGLADIEMAWLVTHLRIERWREALLWAWVVGRVGGASGLWGLEARKEIRSILGLDEGIEGSEAVMIKGNRTTLDDSRKFTIETGWEAAKASEYLFCELFSRIFRIND